MDLSEAQLLLGRTPSIVATLLADLPDAWVCRNDGAGTWSAYDIVGHLVHGEATDWLPRVNVIVSYGTARPFDRFDRTAMLGHDLEPIAELVARFAAARAASLEQLDALSLTANSLGATGLHPDLGEVTLGQLIASWVAHDLTHVAQIGEVLARRYRDDVGPWRAYLPALDNVAHAE